MPTEPNAPGAVTAAAVIVPSHGHGLLRPWQPGQSGNPGGPPKPVREALRLAREATPAAMRELIALLGDPDPRIRLLAANSLLDRGLGRARERPPADDDAEGPPDLSSAEVRQLIMVRLERLRAGIADMDDPVLERVANNAGGVHIILPDNGR
jgi:hypothetical protein